MTEEDAKGWIADRFGTAKVDLLQVYVDLLIAENARQNLVSASTLPAIWARHILDSAQLVPLADDAAARWCDVGSGPGLPGLVAAILRRQETWLVEPRARRAAFLRDTAEALGLTASTYVIQSKVEALREASMGIISARAVAELSSLFGMCHHLTDERTRFILPKGQRGGEELAAVRNTWQGVFHVEQSVTDANSIIIIADGVTRRCSASR
ncbi:16S rRNA (guanine(527)-N(7))-methyltransferase RsmG [Sphingomonas adhaesiva]|uniref:16S rRNA (guanine(527)-N(7))-methyltransferase RsmG n=1 Tax=Sphingomonas adhaesiva TaxID=28212 RepID=UPI002FF926B9